MGYQTSWLTHEHDIALLKAKKPAMPTRHGVESREQALTRSRKPVVLSRKPFRVTKDASNLQYVDSASFRLRGIPYTVIGRRF